MSPGCRERDAGPCLDSALGRLAGHIDGRRPPRRDCRSRATRHSAVVPRHRPGIVLPSPASTSGAATGRHRSFASLPQRGCAAAALAPRCSCSSDSAASGGAKRCARTAPSPRSRSPAMRSWSSSFPREQAHAEAERCCSRNARAFSTGCAGVSDCSRPGVDVGRAAASCDREVLDEVVAGRGASIMGVAAADGHRA
jgi:hypothetical protein